MSSTRGTSGMSPDHENRITPEKPQGPQNLGKESKPFTLHPKQENRRKQREDSQGKKGKTHEKDEKKEEDHMDEPIHDEMQSIFSLAKNTEKPALPPPDFKKAAESPHEKEPKFAPREATLSKETEKVKPKDKEGKEIKEDGLKSPLDLFGKEHSKKKDDGGGSKEHGEKKEEPKLAETQKPIHLTETSAPQTQAVSGASEVQASAITHANDLVNMISTMYAKESHIDGHETTVNLKDGTSIYIKNQEGALSILITTADYRVQKVISDNIGYIRSALSEKGITLRDIQTETSSWREGERQAYDEDKNEGEGEPQR